MTNSQVTPTRMELKRLKTKLTTARRGHKLLKDKRDEMMKLFMERVREAAELRKSTEQTLARVNSAFNSAAAVSSPEMLKEAMLLPTASTDVNVESKNVMSVSVPSFKLVASPDAAPVLNYGFAFTCGELDSAVIGMTKLMPELIKLAEAEKTVQLLADEIEKTRRRVNALEYIMIPQYEEQIKTIVMKLDENERGNTTRLMKVKDMLLERQRKAVSRNENDQTTK